MTARRSRARGVSEAHEQGIKTLTALLRSPKTKAGLVAAVSTLDLPEAFVQGWLAAEIASKKVIKVRLLQAQQEMFALSSVVADINPQPSEFPSWLEPRHVPEYRGRSLHTFDIAGQEQQKEGAPNAKTLSTDRRSQRRP
jgi:hypothetical protein